MSAWVAELRGASRTYRHHGQTVQALAPTNLTVSPGEVLGIAGPSGSGKSTMLRVLGGLECPSGGQVLLGGQPTWRSLGGRPRYPRPGFVMPVFQDPAGSLDHRWPLWRLVTEPLTPGWCRLDARARRAKATELLSSVNLGHVDPESRPPELSVGQCQRVAVLRALAATPGLIIADEPTSALDVISAAATIRLLCDAAIGSTAVVIVSHDRPLLTVVAHRLLEVRDGLVTEAWAPHPDVMGPPTDYGGNNS